MGMFWDMRADSLASFSFIRILTVQSGLVLEWLGLVIASLTRDLGLETGNILW
jgi:hypothetical protein